MKATWRGTTGALLCVVALTSCATVSPLQASGETLAALGDTFTATAAAMDGALDSKSITQSQYAAWWVFADKFQAVYRPAVQLWDVAKATHDATLQTQVAAILTQLQDDLAGFATSSLVARAAHDGGT